MRSKNSIAANRLHYLKATPHTVSSSLMPTAAMEFLWKPRVLTTPASHSSFRIYINKISDMEYHDELLKVLVPMQHEVENAAFSDDEDMDETEDLDMSM